MKAFWKGCGFDSPIGSRRWGFLYFFLKSNFLYAFDFIKICRFVSKLRTAKYQSERHKVFQFKSQYRLQNPNLKISAFLQINVNRLANPHSMLNCNIAWLKFVNIETTNCLFVHEPRKKCVWKLAFVWTF